MDYDDDTVELPCEFCEVLYPWSLIAEHQIVCELNPEVLDFVPFVPAEHNITVEDPILKPEKPVEKVIPAEPIVPILPKIATKNVENPPVEKIIPTEPIVPVLPKVATKNVKNQLSEVKKFTSQTEEFMTKTGEKLLVYGSNIDPVEDLDAEKQSSKITNPLTSNIPKEEDVEDINNLSDDDCEETLEDFWKRARDFLKRNKTRSES